MRPDFKHLLTERERVHGHRPDEKKGHRKMTQKDESQDYEDWAPGGKVSMKKHHTGASKQTKSLNENLTPLTNFLRGSVGRRWDDVYAEIAEACPNDSAVSGHIYQHLWQFVELHPRIEDSETVYASSGWYGKEPLISHQTRPKFYVNHDDILVECPKRHPYTSWKKKVAKERAAYERKLPNGNLAVKVKGIWYEAQLVPFPMPKLRLPDEKHDTYWYEDTFVYDEYVKYSPYYQRVFQPGPFALIYESTRREKLEQYYGKPVYCHALRQLNSREIRQHNLKNDT